MKKIECPNCASANFNAIGWDKYICNYCGTVVKSDDSGNLVRLEVCPKNVIPIATTLEVPREHLTYLMRHTTGITPDGFVKHHLLENMNEILKDFLEIDEEYDPHKQHYRYRGRLSVCK